jgi:hypothetical protein
LGKVAGFQFEFTFQLSVALLSVPFHVCAFREEPENPRVAMSTKIAVDFLGGISIPLKCSCNNLESMFC